MAGWTNKGKFSMMDEYFKATGAPASFNVALVTSANVPDADTNLMSDLTEVSDGTGYTDGGINVTRDATGFDSINEDDANDRGDIQIKDLVWTASGGTLPASDSARYAVLTDNNGTVANREVYAFFDLVSNRQVSDGQTLTLQNCELRVNES